MLAVAAGGSLYQDMRTGAGVKHFSSHEIVACSPLEERLPTTYVNSYHHQAIRRVPFGFDVLASTADGIVESIYTPGFLGVQFHPEMMYPADKTWLDLFSWWMEEGLK